MQIDKLNFLNQWLTITGRNNNNNNTPVEGFTPVETGYPKTPVQTQKVEENALFAGLNEAIANNIFADSETCVNKPIENGVYYSQAGREGILMENLRLIA